MERESRLRKIGRKTVVNAATISMLLSLAPAVAQAKNSAEPIEPESSISVNIGHVPSLTENLQNLGLTLSVDPIETQKTGKVKPLPLISKGTGWDKAREYPQKPIRVWIDPEEFPELNARDALEPWNKLAGWKLFILVRFEKNADVKFELIEGEELDRTYCSPEAYLPHYTFCTIRINNDSSPTIWHELGHVLGFADRVREAYEYENYKGRKILNVHICDGDKDHPLYNPALYNSTKTAMSSCTLPEEYFGPGDLKILQKVGYTWIERPH
jgi:hypothetical protein